MKTRVRFVVVYFFVAHLNRRCGVRPQASGSLALNRRCGVWPQASGRLASDGSSCICNRHLVEPLEPSGRLAQVRRSYLPLLPISITKLHRLSFHTSNVSLEVP